MTKRSKSRIGTVGAVAAIVLAFLSFDTDAKAQKILRAVMTSDVKIIDPIWSGAYITRNHGYMIYDTLFSQDENGDIKPQMVDTFDVSADGLIYKFKLRDGLLWHDGAPVTAEDCVASIKRWAAKDSAGQKLMGVIDVITVNDPKTFSIKLKEVTGLVLPTLGKPSVYVPFMMPKRVADTDPNTQITDLTGSGPFVFKQDEWKPGDKVVYVKFDKYIPRPEPASGLAGGKVVKVDRVEWKAISDQQQAMNALIAGEIDFIEQPSHDLLPLFKAAKNVTLLKAPASYQFTFRPNSTAKPFDNPKVRQALWYALNQDDFLAAAVGDEAYIKPCRSYFPCGSQFATEKGMDGLLTSNFKKSQELLKEAGYDGTPIVLLHSTDLKILANLAPVAKSLMERGGFKVDMQSMDWQTLVARINKKDPGSLGGWHAFLTSWGMADILDPIATGFMSAACEKAQVGWPCDSEMEKLRDTFARESDPVKRKKLAEDIQDRDTQVTTHIPLGEYYRPMAIRNGVSGVLLAPVPVFWNIELN